MNLEIILGCMDIATILIFIICEYGMISFNHGFPISFLNVFNSQGTCFWLPWLHLFLLTIRKSFFFSFHLPFGKLLFSVDKWNQILFTGFVFLYLLNKFNSSNQFFFWNLQGFLHVKSCHWHIAVVSIFSLLSFRLLSHSYLTALSSLWSAMCNRSSDNDQLS